MINKVILVGNLGKDPETKQLENNQVTNFSLATSESYKDKSGNKVNQTEWHNIVLWGKLAEIAQRYLTKGDRIYLEGKIRTEKWVKDGETKYRTTIVGNTLQMLSTKSEESRMDKVDKIMEETEDIPF